MGVIGSKKLKDALAKAKTLGQVEETFTLDNCEISLRNLRPDEYISVLEACRGLDDVSYLHAYQTEQLARAIVAIGDVDFHGIEFVEDEVPDPKDPDKTRTVKVELHAFLLKNVLSTWSKEAIYTAYRKFTDVVDLAERKAKEGVTFLLPEETAEERYRRLLLEAKECEEDLPPTMIDHVLGEMGMMRKTTAEELKAAMERTDKLAREAAGIEDIPTVSEEEVQESPVQESPVPPPPAQPAPASTAVKPKVTDPHQTLQQAIAARQKSSPPVQPQTAPQVTAEEAARVNRTSKIAALEADAVAGTGVDPTLDTLPSKIGDIPVYRPAQQEVVELRKQERLDPAAATTILDQPPVPGINPRFRPPPKA